jgi:hypothetical protein
MYGWMFCVDVFLCEGFIKLSPLGGRIEGSFGITVQSKAFCSEHILAQEFEQSKFGI